MVAERLHGGLRWGGGVERGDFWSNSNVFDRNALPPHTPSFQFSTRKCRLKGRNSTWHSV